MNVTKVAGLVGIATAMNAVANVRKSGPMSAMGTIFGGVALFAGLAAVGEFVDWKLAAVLASLFLLATFLTKGSSAIDWFSRLVEGL